MLPVRADGYLTTAEAADLAGVRPVTIRRWRRLGYLAPQGLDERGYPLHTPEAVREAEKAVHDRGVLWSLTDPRKVRKGARGEGAGTC